MFIKKPIQKNTTPKESNIGLNKINFKDMTLLESINFLSPKGKALSYKSF